MEKNATHARTKSVRTDDVRLGAREIDAPDRLDRCRKVEAIWRDPTLLFGQTCGYSVVTDAGLAL